MKGLREKFRKNEGFTLVEMLIVVAIIAILIAVSIPMVANSLEKAKHATDQANNRSAMALGSLKYLNDYDDLGFSDKVSSVSFQYFVNGAHQGTLAASAPTGYVAVKSQCKCNTEGTELTVTITDAGVVSTNWTFTDD